MIKNIFLFGLTLTIGIVSTGCNSESTEGAYIGYLKIDGQHYIWQGDIEHEKFTVGEKIGEVNKKVDKEIMPEANFSSNFLEEGKEIFASNEDSRVILVKSEHDREYEKLIEAGYYEDARKTAWDFLVEKGWSGNAKEEWASGEVTEIIINEDYELLDENYEGKEVLAVYFEDKENTVTSTPVILVDPTPNKVVGYMSGE